jgi:hypothetical protein
MGKNLWYIPRENVNLDRLFGEDQLNKFTKAYQIEMYIASAAGFEGTHVITKFGLEVKDRINLVVSKKRFNNEIAEKYDGITRPREGDLIYFPLSKSLFEINFVEHENPLYPLGKLYSYQITAELFTYSYEKIQTLNKDINSPYTSTTAGLSGSVIIPIANNLGITLGVNDQLQTEGNSYGFNPNDPFSEDGCTGGS